MTMIPPLPLKTLLKRGFQHKCPQCGTPGLFIGYLKTSSHCSSCQLDFEKIRSDDAPAYFTISLVAHIVVPLAFTLGFSYNLSLWTQLALWPFVIVILTILLLPRIKGMVMAVLWKIRN